MKNKYKTKYISVLGDSISTFQGYNPDGFNVFYSPEKQRLSGVISPEDTWWGFVIKSLGGKMLINNSWSGSRVSKIPQYVDEFPSGCSNERSGGLHSGDITPDVIIVYLGTNDWGHGVPPYRDMACGLCEIEVFDIAYETMIARIKANYPCAEVWCCTLCTTYMKSNPSFTFPYTFGGYHIEDYCDIIKEKAQMFNCRLIDLYSENTPYDAVDGSHPTKKGMKTLAKIMLKYIRKFDD